MLKKFILLEIALSFGIISYAIDIADYKLELKDFSELKVNDCLNIEYRCSNDSAGYVFFSCEPEIASNLLFTSKKNSLNIQVADDFDNFDRLPTIKVYSSMLEKVENGSDSTLFIISNQPVKSLKARVIGNGTIIFNSVEATSVDLGIVTGRGHIVVNKGNTFKAKYSNVGTGTIEAGNLNSSQVKVIISGTGNIDCNASESLSVYGMGSGSVYYSGEPSKISNRSVGIKAFPVKTTNN